jgi:hypothetical protein
MTEELLEASLKEKIAAYHQWRNALADTIIGYRDWLVRSDSSNSLQELRLTDFADMLRKDRLTLALVAEFSRGKTETINALFFADHDQRLLPSEAGRTTMCPTELLWEEDEEPCIKLLPIETRLTDDSLTYLKTLPKLWKKFRLETDFPEQMRKTLRQLIEKKEVSIEEAIKLGLWSPKDPNNALQNRTTIEVPVWRHAIINYPHELLKNGLVVIDTPGLNALGTEPELTHKVIPGAHAVLFLTATDTGVTHSDMQIWNEYIRDQAKYKLVVLNKIDTLWDDLKSEFEINKEINRQVEHTARDLMIPKHQIFTISAQKGLLAKIKKDPVLLKRSNIQLLEKELSNQLTHAKQEIIGDTVAKECSEMVKESRKLMQVKLNHSRVRFNELKGLLGQHQTVFNDLVAKAQFDQERYQSSLPVFKEAEEKINRIGKKLLRHLSLTYLDNSIAETRKEMHDSWTTVRLNQSIRKLMKQANDLAIHVTTESNNIRRLAQHIYDLFRTQHGFDISAPPELNMTGFLEKMQSLEKITHDFCADPINVLTEKRFLIRRFFLSLGAEAQGAFQTAHDDTERWINNVIVTLKIQIETHKEALDQRIKGLMDAKSSSEALNKQITQVSLEYKHISSQCKLLDDALLQLMKAILQASKIKQEKLEKENQLKALHFEGLPLV